MRNIGTYALENNCNKCIITNIDGSTTTYNLEVKEVGFLLVPKFYTLSGNKIIRVADGEVVRSGLMLAKRIS